MFHPQGPPFRRRVPFGARLFCASPQRSEPAPSPDRATRKTTAGTGGTGRLTEISKRLTGPAGRPCEKNKSEPPTFNTESDTPTLHLLTFITTFARCKTKDVNKGTTSLPAGLELRETFASPAAGGQPSDPLFCRIRTTGATLQARTCAFVLTPALFTPSPSERENNINQ